MLSTVITVIGLLCLAVGIVCTALYIPAKRALRTAYRELLHAEAEAIQPARQKYWGLDKRQQRLALTCLGAYALGLFSILPLGHAQNHYQMAAVIGLTLCVWVVSYFASFGKSEWEIRMEVEDEKHRAKMEALRRQAANGGE